MTLVREQAFSYVLEANEFFKSIQTDDLMMIHGIIDGYIELDDEIIVFDYKSGLCCGFYTRNSKHRA